MSRLGIELCERELRVVRLSAFGRVVESFSLPCATSQPEHAVQQLAIKLPGTHELSIAISHTLLSVVHVSLPPANYEAREQMLALDPERYFASATPNAVALAPKSDIAFGFDTALSERWHAALRTLGSVVRMEPAPLSLARALGSRATGVYRVGSDAPAIVSIRTGAIESIRRSEALSGEAPRLPGVGAEYLAAYGAARGELADQDGSFFSMDRRRALRRSARRATFTTVVSLLAALTILGAAADSSRARLRAALQVRADSLEAAAQPALDQMRRVANLNEEASLLATRVPSTSHVLAIISKRLPDDAVITSLRMRDGTWELDGTTRRAASVVPALAAEPLLVGVSTRAASARFLEGSRARETFSVTFHVRTP